MLGIGVSFFLVFVKLLAGHIGHSYALVADATESSADVLSSGLLWIGLRIAQKPPDMLRPAINEVMDAAPSKEIVGRVRNLASQNPMVLKVEKSYVRKMGFDYFVDIHIQVNGALSVTEGHAIAHAVKSKLLESNLRIKDVLVHVEPFNQDPASHR
jgi:divalent metal cation (Fe/Co/Zn/Cd) transporter